MTNRKTNLRNRRAGDARKTQDHLTRSLRSTKANTSNQTLIISIHLILSNHHMLMDSNRLNSIMISLSYNKML